jgi:hypothetical protein
MALTAYMFDQAAEDIHHGDHDFSSDTFKVALSNTAPSASGDAVIGDITQIANGNGYTTGGLTLTVTSATQTGGTFTFVITSDLTWTGGPSSMAEFRYYILYSATNNKLIGWWDRGAGLVVLNGWQVIFKSAAATLYQAAKTA